MARYATSSVWMAARVYATGKLIGPPVRLEPLDETLIIGSFIWGATGFSSPSLFISSVIARTNLCFLAENLLCDACAIIICQGGKCPDE